MTSKASVALIYSLFFVGASSHAATGKVVVERCNHAYMASMDKNAKVNQQDAAWCYGYISSTIDTATAYQSMISVSAPFCIPANTDMSILLLAIVGKGPSDKASMERNGSEMLINIFRSLYPCKK